MIELIGIESSSITALFLASRPEGQPYLPHAVTELVKRYNFAAFPTQIGEMAADKVQFKFGIFRGDPIDALDVYRDGVVVTSRTRSEPLDAFLADLVGWMDTALGLRRIETHAISKSYESNLMIRTEVRLLKALDAIKSIQEMLSKSVKSATGLDAKFEPFGLSFAVDQTLIPGMKPSAFRLERRVGLSFQSNYYVSTAPLPTSDHMAVLDRLAKLGS
jgi:hypothetical protein